MAEAVENLVLEILRKIQSDVSDIKSDNREMKSRIGLMETRVAHIDVQLAEISLRIDRRDDAFERMVRRLEITEITPLTH
jgi:hypothetical protein